MTNKELIEKLNQVKNFSSGGNPNEEWVASNKSVMMSQIKPNSQNESLNEKVDNSFYYGQYFSGLFRQSFLKPAIATFALVFMMLGYSATLGIANASLPGDMFYPVKTTKEKVQLALTFEENEKVKLQMTFVSNRADELQQIVKTTSDSDKKTATVKKTAQQITKDINNVKEKLTKISIAAVDVDKIGVIEAAKEIDTKTLAVKQGLLETQNILSNNDKNGVDVDIKQAIANTEEAGASALGVIIQKYESGETSIDGTEIASRVADRIKDAQVNIEGANKVINNVPTSTTTLINSSTKTVSSTSTAPTLSSIKDQPQAAQVVIDEAKNLLDQNNFSLALVKISETNKLVSTVEENVRVIVNEINNVANPIATSTSGSL